METDPSLLSFNVAFGVLLVDILLSGDNAIVIALVCRTLSKEHRTKALWLGVIGAFVARLALTSSATLAMNLPLIKLIGGILLLKISIELIVDNANQDTNTLESQHSSAQDIFSAARTIVLADIVMSLDNVLALSAITQNNWQMLVAGLLLSIPILMFGSMYISRLLDVFPYLLWFGGAILGGVSGALMIGDPIFGGTFSDASSLAPLVVPIVAAGFVVQISRVIVQSGLRMQALAKPPSLIDILWAGGSDGSVARSVAEISSMEKTALQAVAIPQSFALDPDTAIGMTMENLETAPRPEKPMPMRPSFKGEHKILIALGLFMILTGSALYYMLSVYQPAVPDLFINYVCKQPAMTISYMPHGKEIQFTTSQGMVTTSVLDDRIVWDDLQGVSAKYSVAFPEKILSADAGKLVVNGGMFERTTCIAVSQR